MFPQHDQTQQRKEALDAIDERIRDLRSFLEESAPECFETQNHLDASQSERVFWHHGYLLALMDVRDLISGKKARLS
jgi:hypothetical protein